MMFSKWIAIGLVAPLLACGSSSGGTSTADMKLMDAPPEGVTAVNLWINAIQVHVTDKSDPKDGDPMDASIDDDGKWSTLIIDRSIDLVQHQGESAADALGQLTLPEGKVTQIRLVLDATKSNTAVKETGPCDLDLTRVDYKGTKIGHPFKAFESKTGARHEIWLDLELDESMINEGACFRLRPVIKLHKVKTDGADVDTVKS